MNSSKANLKQPMNHLIAGGTREDHDVEIQRKIIMINIISIIGILNLIPFGISALAAGNSTLGYFDLAVAFVLIINQFHLRKTGNHSLSSYCGVGVAGALFFYLFVTGGVDMSGPLWFYTFPLFASFLLGSKRGAMATFLLLCSSILFISMNNASQAFAIYTTSFTKRFIMSFLVVFLFAYFFEAVRRDTQQKLVLSNAELEQNIIELKETKEALEKNRDDLELRVEERTNELKKANQELEMRVSERTASIAKVNEELSINVAELRCAKEKLKQAKDVSEMANRTKSEFLANMSHELRTPLNHIIGFTELVVDKNFGDLNKIQEEYLNDALNSSRHLLSLINDILDLSKVEAGKMEFKPSDVNLPMLLENSLNMIKEKAMQRNLHLSTHVDGISETIKADERKLKQIMYNLVSNAVKFTPENGSIALAAKMQTEYSVLEHGKPTEHTHIQNLIPGIDRNFIEISVKDTGIGLKPEALECIFNPFEQVERSASRRFHGTGLGLSLTKRLVELHGGRIWAESEGEGKGSVFTFIIPG